MPATGPFSGCHTGTSAHGCFAMQQALLRRVPSLTRLFIAIPRQIAWIRLVSFALIAETE